MISALWKRRPTTSHQPHQSSRGVLAQATSLCVTTIAVIGFSGQALAACYTPKEANAEQAIRAHSEMMVVGLTCATYFNEPTLFNRYATFTNTHRQAIQGYEETMISYFRKTAEGNPKRRFDHWRTSIANAVSTRAALSSGPVYCQKKAGMLDAMAQANDFNANGLSVILASAPEAVVVSRPMCVQDAIASSGSE
ncbi:MAG: hypothetical protein AAF213_11335 [Pseudomonadota bacterium]